MCIKHWLSSNQKPGPKIQFKVGLKYVLSYTDKHLEAYYEIQIFELKHILLFMIISQNRDVLPY